jgi:hypothetical protein
MIRTLAFVFAKTNPILPRLRLRIPAVKAAALGPKPLM